MPLAAVTAVVSLPSATAMMAVMSMAPAARPRSATMAIAMRTAPARFPARARLTRTAPSTRALFLPRA